MVVRLSDLVGADVGMHVGKNFTDSFPDRVYGARLMVLMNKYQRLGEKTRKGFYKVIIHCLILFHVYGDSGGGGGGWCAMHQFKRGGKIGIVLLRAGHRTSYLEHFQLYGPSMEMHDTHKLASCRVCLLCQMALGQRNNTL